MKGLHPDASKTETSSASDVRSVESGILERSTHRVWAATIPHATLIRKHVFAPLGIGPGLTFRPNDLPAAAWSYVADIPAIADEHGLAENIRFSLVQGWVYLGSTIARFGTDYAFRAAVADGGFANPVDLAMYPPQICTMKKSP